MKTLLLVAGVLVALSTIPSGTALSYRAPTGDVCTEVDPQCICKIIDSAEGTWTDPPSGENGAMPIAPIPHGDGTATWIMVCIN